MTLSACANTLALRAYEHDQAEAQRREESIQARANEIEEDAIDYFGGDLLNIEGLDDEGILEAYRVAAEIAAAVLMPQHHRMADAELGARVRKAINKRAALLAEEYARREAE